MLFILIPKLSLTCMWTDLKYIYDKVDGYVIFKLHKTLNFQIKMGHLYLNIILTAILHGKN